MVVDESAGSYAVWHSTLVLGMVLAEDYKVLNWVGYLDYNYE